MGKEILDFQTNPANYKHWRMEVEGEIANIYMDVNEDGGFFDGYKLKLNSYDIGVDVELSDLVQRMRFEHPEVKVVVMKSGKDNIFCAGANIRMLASATHAHKVNFCKFTNETRNTFEAALEDSSQNYISAVKGACAGGGYELALASNYIMLADDRTSNVSLPEVPLLAVLPGTGGLTRVVDKRKVRRDLADIFSSSEEGVKGQRACDWRFIDELIPNATFNEDVAQRAKQIASELKKKNNNKGISLTPLDRTIVNSDTINYSTVKVFIDRAKRIATITIEAKDSSAPKSIDELHKEGDKAWMLRCARELDDAILHLRFNELDIGTWIFKTVGDSDAVLAYEKKMIELQDNTLASETLLFWKRILKRIDVTSRSLIALVEPKSCFAGTLAEILFACDRTYMAEGDFSDIFDTTETAHIVLSEANFGLYPMGNDLTRLQTRFYGEPQSVTTAQTKINEKLTAKEADALGLITFAYDSIDWEDEIRVFLEERTGFSPDALTGMEANLRFAGPETMETRIFSRLTAWQNWIFQRPNAVGEKGALRRYGTGYRGEYDMNRV